MFENALTWTKQGDIGEARAIYDLTKKGYTVSRTIFDSAKYDLIVDNGTKLLKVQVKTTSYKADNKSKCYVVSLKTSGGSSTQRKIRKREDSDYDYLFVMSDDDTAWFIPVDKIEAKSSLYLNSNYDEYKL